MNLFILLLLPFLSFVCEAANNPGIPSLYESDYNPVILSYKFKHPKAKEEYLKYKGDDCVHLAQKVQLCGKNAHDHNDAYMKCITNLGFHPLLNHKLERFPHNLFNFTESFNREYSKALLAYVKDLDKSFEGLDEPAESKIVFKISFIAWGLLVLAICLVYWLNTSGTKQSQSIEAVEQAQNNSSIYETV